MYKHNTKRQWHFVVA